MKKFRILLPLATIFPALLLLGGCSIFGLDLQEKYDYDYSAPYDNQLNQSAWEFIQANAGTFSIFIDAVEKAGIDPEIFNQPNLTIFPLHNDAINASRGTGSGNNQHPGGYWKQHLVNGVAPDDWTWYDKEDIKQFVLNHIIDGYAISYNEFLDLVPGGQRTFFPTKATNGYGYVSIHMLNFNDVGSAQASFATNLYINDFESHYTRVNPSGWGGYLFPRTHNLQTSNGSYIHVMQHFLDFPNDEDLETNPVYGRR